jgi:hypothetical protein
MKMKTDVCGPLTCLPLVAELLNITESYIENNCQYSQLVGPDKCMLRLSIEVNFHSRATRCDLSEIVPKSAMGRIKGGARDRESVLRTCKSSRQIGRGVYGFCELESMNTESEEFTIYYLLITKNVSV